MSRRVFPRLARTLAVVCLLVAAAIVASRASARPLVKLARVADVAKASRELAARSKYPTAPLVIGDGVLAYPPRAETKRRATVVYLHGIHGRAENGCPWLKDGASELGWLVCPEANVPEGPGFTWSGLGATRAIVERAEHAAVSEGADPKAPGVLVGFSQGAYYAVDLVDAGLGRYDGLVLLGADVTPDPARLANAGVKRVVLGAGTLDGSYGPLTRAAAGLAAHGVDVRFVSLGRVGHTYIAEDPKVLGDAIAWAGGA